MESAYLDKDELATLFHASYRTAQAALAERGVLPIKLGGRTSRLLWDRKAVMLAMDMLRTEASVPPSEYVKPRKGDLTIAGKSTADIIAMVTLQ